MRLKALKKQRESLKVEFKAWLDKIVGVAQEEGRGLNEEEQAKQATHETRRLALELEEPAPVVGDPS